MSNKCDCGYVATSPYEVQMLENWGCARAIQLNERGGSSLRVECCSRGGVPPEIENNDGGIAFKEHFLKKYNNGNKEK